MAESSFVRISVPKSIKADEIIRVRALAVHQMDGIERDKQGAVIARAYNFIYKCIVTYNGKIVLEISPTQSISSNPYFAFPLKVTAPGEIKIVFEDSSGQKHEASKKIVFS